MKILILAGAAESLVGFRLPLLLEMVARGHEVVAAAPCITTAIKAQLAAKHIATEDVPLARTGVSFLADLHYAQSLKKIIQSHKPAAVFAYTHKPIVYGIPIAYKEGVPIRVAFVTGLGYVFTGRGWRRRIISWFLGFLYRRALRCATSLKFQNPDDVADFQRLGILSTSVGYQIVGGSGIPLQDYPAVKVPFGPLRFLMLSRLLVDKGVREFVQAARLVRKHFPQARFILAGEIDSNPTAIKKSELDAWIAEKSIEYIGKLSDVRPELAECSAYVLPSYREGTPRSVLEAMATGRAIVTTDAPGCRETVRQPVQIQGTSFKRGENGYLVKVADPESLAAALMDLCRSPHFFQSMGNASRAYAEQKYDVIKVNQCLLDWGALQGLTNSCSKDT